MEGATDYEDQGSLKNPVNQVVAVFAPEIDTEEVVSYYTKQVFRRNRSEC